MSIRIKLLLVGLFFMAIPLMAYQFITDMQKLLQKGQEQALLLEARAISNVLHERQELFSKDTGIVLNTENSSNLYAQAKIKPIKIDGRPDDWVDILNNARFFGKDNQIFGSPPKSDQDFSFWHLLAYDKDFIYALFQISDNQVNFRNETTLNLAQSDHLRIYLSNKNTTTSKHYLLNATKPGIMSAYLVKKDWHTPVTGKHNSNFFAYLDKTNIGYNIELRIPLNLVTDAQHIAFAVVDYQPKDIKIIGTIDPLKDPKLNRILLKSPHIENILGGLDKSNGRIWVVDSYQRVRAVAGNLQPTEITTNKESNWIDSLFSIFLNETDYNFTDRPKNIETLTNQSILDALDKKSNTFVRQSLDGKVTILGAAVPIESNDKVVGAVIVEQTNHDILVLENKALMSVMQQIATIFLIAIFTIVWFAIRLTYRINRLHQETNEATESGKIKADAKITVHSKDELGKLAQSIATMLSSLSQHTLYLERMPRTLRHEILNPLSVISMSLENLNRIANPSEKEQKYLNSAQNGIKRLGAILHSLTEASNLELALVNEDRSYFDLAELLREYMSYYKELHPEHKFQIDIPDEPLFMMGWPESIAQMLDKVLDNSVDFNQAPAAIKVSLSLGNPSCIFISNQGSHIPMEIQENIFESMVSKRSDKYKQKPHLGIGLYVARMITEAHNGKISVKNTYNPQGVEFMICLSSKKSNSYWKSF